MNHLRYENIINNIIYILFVRVLFLDLKNSFKELAMACMTLLGPPLVSLAYTISYISLGIFHYAYFANQIIHFHECPLIADSSFQLLYQNDFS